MTVHMFKALSSLKLTTGKVLGAWGKHDPKDMGGFGACCNPMSLCLGPGGALYTAEAGLGRINRYRAMLLRISSSAL